jgi:hypothetical protein
MVRRLVELAPLTGFQQGARVLRTACQHIDVCQGHALGSIAPR